MIGVTFQPDVDRECYGARGREVNSADSPSPGMAALSQGGSTIVQAVRVTDWEPTGGELPSRSEAQTTESRASGTQQKRGAMAPACHALPGGAAGLAA